MKAKIKRIIPVFLVVSAIMGTGISTYAASKVSITLAANQAWTKKYAASRSKQNSNVLARCHSVYPRYGGTDNFQKIQCRIVDGAGTQMCYEVVTLSETATGNTSIPIRNGFLNASTAYFQFRGNTSSAANAVVSYYGN